MTLTHARMTQSRLYVLIDAFENDMRNVLERYVLELEDERTALGASFERADERRQGDVAAEGTPITAYLDLQETYDILNRHREILPEELGNELRKNTPLMSQLVPIRNRVMHGRPLLPGDPENALTSCSGFTTRYWKTVKETLDHLVTDTTWEPAFERQPKRAERVIHNLPLPEYDETGLLGRSLEKASVVKYLLRRREPVITILGEGGIGKTALALEVASEILDNRDSPYECILWVSLKTERLTTSGITAVADAVKGITGAATALGQAVVEDFDGGIDDLSAMLDGIETLLVVDNLETVDGSEVVRFYEAMPACVTFLFTSRIGIGQIERRIELGPLAQREAERLFREFSRMRGIGRLANLKQSTVTDAVRRLRTSPLAIRWYVLAVGANGQPDLALSNQDVLLEFCVRSVYKAMSQQPRVILAALFALDREVTFDELAVFTDLTVDELRRAVHDLQNGSMVHLEPDSETELVSRIRLTESARNFLRKVQPPDSRLVENVLQREREFQRADASRRAEQKERQLSPNAVRIRTPLDVPVAHLLRRALISARNGATSQWLESISKARALNPEYWEVDRVEAHIMSSVRQIESATAMFRSALRKASDEEGAAVISFHFASHLGKRAGDFGAAIDYARVAHRYFESAESANLLGSLLTWNRSFDEGQTYLEFAHGLARGRLKLANLTVLIESWSTWSDELCKIEKRPIEALDRARKGFALGEAEVRAGTCDLQLASQTLRCASSIIGVALTPGVSSSDVTKPLIEVISFLSEYKLLFERSKRWGSFRGVLGSLLRDGRIQPVVHAACGALLRLNKDEIAQSTRPEKVLVGRVNGWRGTFGFISHPRYPDDVFFPASVVERRTREAELALLGREVEFRAEPDGRGRRPRAEWVRIVRQRSRRE